VIDTVQWYPKIMRKDFAVGDPVAWISRWMQ
jgi:hypothetical protein